MVASFHSFPANAIMGRYECDKCGACCKGSLIVEADAIDVLREPRLIDADKYYRGETVDRVVFEIVNEGRVVLLACGSPSSFLGPDNQCSIYPTRPNCCVGMEPGDEQCQAARRSAGLVPLEPLDDVRSDRDASIPGS